MDRVNEKGNKRGMCFTPRWSTCKDCGAPFYKDAARRQLCASCRIEHIGTQKEKQRIRSMERYYRQKNGTDGKTEAGPGRIGTVCGMWRQCKYGGDRFGCAYAAITGRLRSSGGKHQIIDGKCDLFQAGRKKRRGWHDAYEDDKWTEYDE